MRSRRGKAIGIFLFCLFAVGVSLAQKLKQLAAFDVTNGYYAPNGSLIMANGDFYGSTQFGGGRATGTIFHLTPEGALTTIYEFVLWPTVLMVKRPPRLLSITESSTVRLNLAAAAMAQSSK